MIYKRVNLEELISFLGDDILFVDGNIDGIHIDNLADVQHVNESTLDWVNPSKQDKQQIAEHSRARVLLVDENIISIPGKILIHVRNPKTALAKVGNNYFVERPKPYIHPTAIVDDNAAIGEGVYIGPYCVIGKVKIGNNCIIEPFVRIYDDVVMGEDCHIYDHVVLGATGFGLQRNEEGNWFRFPQIGSLVIGKCVEVGSHTSIDRGALSDTIIGDYTKIDSACKIAHNNVIGKNVAITGHCSVAGSNVIEDDVWIGPNSSINNWGFIGKGARIGIGSVVVLKVKEGAKVFGNPAKKLKIE